MTFSIAARDGDAWGVAVASRFLAVGAVVPRIRTGIGAVATQSHARVAYLDEVLDALAASIMHYPQCNGSSEDLSMTDQDRAGVRTLYGS
jgi:uncharacterized Ntn-hydrolase superfamily protein